MIEALVHALTAAGVLIVTGGLAAIPYHLTRRPARPVDPSRVGRRSTRQGPR